MSATAFLVREVPTTPIEGQTMGTSGLRKQVRVVTGTPNYLQNFVQAILLSLPEAELHGPLLIGGDGRYYNREAIQIILSMMAANGVRKAVVAQDGLMSTPAGSAIIRARHLTGGILLTASHNPGGPHGDFGVKFNTSNGGPSLPELTDAIATTSKTLTQYKIADLPVVDLHTLGVHNFGSFEVEIIDPVEDYLNLMKSSFDFAALRQFVEGTRINTLIDSMHAVTGIYTKRIFVEELGFPVTALRNATPKEDFGGGHPDPNLTYAKELVDLMYGGIYDFGAAFDGDGDRNLILGKQFFVTPSDSLAVLAANWEKIPYFKLQGFKGVARSMPTSGAVDRVVQAFEAEGRQTNFAETPTGWKFFGNLMDSGKLSLCGEESFGTGCDLIREKDGIWAVLAWLSVIAECSKTAGHLVAVSDIVSDHWSKFGRHFYCRYDYEGVSQTAADQVMDHLTSLQASGELRSARYNGYALSKCDNFSYTDPIDHSVTSKQGIRFIFEDGSRIIFRLSGTGSVGATIRVYFDKYEGAVDKIHSETETILMPLIQMALEWSKMAEFTGRTKPTVKT
ncbi:phosphoglucomutase, chloroplastic [Pelomyxa schiedti]|nr:phosphoglucomutase, chloroplastic [Pelomyxa schiedti]